MPDSILRTKLRGRGKEGPRVFPASDSRSASEFVTVREDKTASAKTYKSYDARAPQHLEVNIVPGKTTAKDLERMLKRLNIKDIRTDVLKRIAGKNGCFDKGEFNGLDDEIENYAAASKAADPQYSPALQAMRAGGIETNSDIIFYLTPQKASNAAFINGLITLRRAGIRISGDIIRALNVARTADPVILSKLIEMHRCGIMVNGDIIDCIPSDTLLAQKFMNVWIRLHKDGVLIDKRLLEGFKDEKPIKAVNERYIATLLELHSAGIDISGHFISCFTMNKAMDRAYVEALLEYHRKGVNVTTGFVSCFSIEQALSPDYKSCLLELHNAGIDLRAESLAWLGSDIAGDPVYIRALILLDKHGINVEDGLVGTLTREKASDPHFMAALIRLRNAGIVVDKHHVEDLTPANAADKVVIDRLISFHKAGIEVESSILTYITGEIVRDQATIDIIMKMHKAGIEIQGNMLGHMTPDKVKNARYVKTIFMLHRAGLPIDGEFVNQFTIEKSRGHNYIDALMRLSRAGVRVTGYFVQNLSIEKASDRNYMGSLMEMRKAKLEIMGETLVQLKPEKANDPEYMKWLLRSKGLFRKADHLYVHMKTGYDIHHISNKDLLTLYFRYQTDRIMGPIIDKLLRDRFLPLVARMNYLHNRPDAERIAKIKDLSPEELGVLMIHAREEVYTSTFNLIFRKLMEGMKANKINAQDLIEHIDPYHKNYRALLTTCANYGRLKEFLDTISDRYVKNELLKVFILGLGASKEELKDSVSIAELMVYEKDTEISLLLSGYLLKAYETASDPDTKKLYAIIASEYYAERHFEPFKRFAAMYPMNPITEIYVKDLLNNNKEIVEQQYFYDDDDGEMNYGQLMSGAGDYKVEDRGTYVKLSRTNAAGIKLSIYANKPDKSEGIDDIHNEFAERHLRSIIVVHRGHSFHAQETIDQIPDIARIVMLGSCGGFGMILQVKEKAPKASIVSTKGTGTITVNAPLLANIHNALLDSSILVWRDVWQKTEKSIMNLDDFAYYVRPDKNIGSNIIGTYNASK